MVVPSNGLATGLLQLTNPKRISQVFISSLAIENTKIPQPFVKLHRESIGLSPRVPSQYGTKIFHDFPFPAPNN